MSSCGRSHTIPYHPYHMMTSYDTAAICQSVLVENDVRMGVPSWVHKELSKSYREGTPQKLKSMALPCKTMVREKSCHKKVQHNFLTAFLVQKATAISIQKWSLAYKMISLGKKTLPPTEGNGEKHQNLHKTVIRRTFRDFSGTKMHSF